MNVEKILLVEDDPLFASMVSANLGQNGYDVTLTATAADFFEKVDSNIYDCLIMDLTLPDEDGIVDLLDLFAVANHWLETGCD